MALGPRLDLRTSQTLVMTPQLQQAIKLLQMSNLEVAEYVEQQIEQNPLLEREDPEGGFEALGPGEEPNSQPQDPLEAAGQDSGIYAEEATDTPDTVDQANSETLLERDNAALDTDYENMWDNRSASDGEQASARWDVAGMQTAYAGEMPSLESVLAEEITLREHLLEQISVDLNDPVERIIAGQLVETLDESGYLTVELPALAEALGCPAERVAATLDKIQRFDPPGIFARNLAECLALQLKDKNRLDPAMEALLDNLDLLAKRDFAALRRLCGVDAEDLAEMVDEIKALNPKPASVFDHSVAQPVTPDIFVRAGQGGVWVVELNSETLPRVLVNSRYYARLNARARDKAEKQYLIDCHQTGSWLVKALQQRAQTILKVATELVLQQSEFFSKGVRYLRPLTLRDIAEEVGVHESTVSRVTNNKYLASARGIFELKYFFTTAIAQIGTGDAHSAEAVRFQIKTLIDQESPTSVLSDDKIVEILRQEGVDIARRTVAKYREAMRIPSSVQRRREKALQA